jgi:hydroxysqualene synthase
MSSIDHYENFPVASWLCPAQLRPAVAALYHFARTADDLADEGHEPAHHRLDALGEYRADLQNCLSQANMDSVNWPHIFGPLRLAVQQYQLPAQPLFDLLDAFEQDVVYTSVGQGYRNRAELMDYCRRSANPVGRLMLHLYGVNDASSLAQSDAICTALQLINFWQDRAQDLRRGRDYLPEGHSLSEELSFARELMMQGAPLVHRVKGRAGWELRAVVQGGLRILDKLNNRDETSDHTRLTRPTLHKPDFIRIAWRCIRM